MPSIAENLAAVEDRIAAAADRAGRDPADVRLVAVTKTFGPGDVSEAVRAGARLLGENRVQEAAAKIPLCPSAEWHLIGHLQGNKVRRALELFSAFHSVDTVKLLEEIAKASDETGCRPGLLLEVNVAGEASKFGFRPDDVADALRTACSLGLSVTGLMTVPPFRPDPEAVRPVFRALRGLRDRLQDETGFGLPELSMGMSHDFEVAIEEGATFVRVGSAIFGRRSARPRPPDATGEET
jgi:pyridoxal phosphate enzyme (YggS family)